MIAVKKPKNLEGYYDSRAVRLDLVAFDENDVVYDAEAQQKNTGLANLSRRSRYYQAQIDINLLEPGEEEFENLNDTYVIFISPFDLFGLGKYKYTFRMRCEEASDLILPDGQIHIFLNTHGTNKNEVSSELAELLDFMEHTQKKKRYQSQRVEALSRQVADIKANQEVGIRYMRFRDEFLIERMEARAEGRAEGREFHLIKQICKKIARNKSIEEIADALEEEVSLVREICDVAGEFAPDYDVNKILCPISGKMWKRRRYMGRR